MEIMETEKRDGREGGRERDIKGSRGMKKTEKKTKRKSCRYVREDCGT